MKRVPGTDLFWYETRLPPDARVSYEFVRNYEERIPDPRNPRKVPALRFMSGKPARVEVSSLAMPGWQEPAHLRQEPPESARGRLETLEIVAATGAKATVVVYLPAGYEAGTSRHPAAYVLGGDGARDLGLVPRSLDNLVGASVAPVIVVFVGAVEWGAKKPDSEEEGPAEAALLAREVVPAVDRRFRTRSEATSRAAVGAGFDAWTAAYAAFHFPDVFGMVATQSLTMLSSDETKLQKEVRTAAERPLRVYQDWGRYDLRGTREAWDMAEANRRFASFLGERGYQPLGGQANDGFGWASWRNRTDRVFEALFPAAPATQGIAPTTRLP
jgi:enterochelin esterase family protein